MISINIKEVCSIENCNENVKSKGFCQKHYFADYREKNRGICKNPICKRHAVLRKGLCEACYKIELYKDKEYPKQKGLIICAVEECDNYAHSKGYCNTHYRHFSLYGIGECENYECNYKSVLYKGECTKCIKEKRLHTKVETDNRCAIKKCLCQRDERSFRKLCSVHEQQLINGMLTLCSINNCERVSYSRTYCYNHYTQYQRWQQGKGKHPEDLQSCAIINCTEIKSTNHYCTTHSKMYLTEDYKLNGVKCVIEDCESIIHIHRRGMCISCYDQWRHNNNQHYTKREEFEHWRRKQMIARPNKLFLNPTDETPENIEYGKVLIAFLDRQGNDTSRRLYLSA